MERRTGTRYSYAAPGEAGGGDGGIGGEGGDGGDGNGRLGGAGRGVPGGSGAEGGAECAGWSAAEDAATMHDPSSSVAFAA